MSARDQTISNALRRAITFCERARERIIGHDAGRSDIARAWKEEAQEYRRLLARLNPETKRKVPK